MTIAALKAVPRSHSDECEIFRLRRENEELRHRMEDLERAFGLDLNMPPISYQPKRFNAGHCRARTWDLMGLIATRRSITRDQAMTALYDYGADDPPDAKIIDVLLVWVRRYLLCHKIVLRTHWGRGWSVSEKDQRRLKALIERLRSAG